MKKTLMIVLLASACYAGKAQKSGFSLGLEAGVPVGENGKPYSHILGGSLQYEARPDADLGITFSGGYSNWAIKSKYGGSSVGFVPLLAGVKYYFSPSVFGHAQLGAAIGTAKDQGTSFTYSPGIGIKLSPNIDAELKYTGIANNGGSLNNVGLRLGFNF